MTSNSPLEKYQYILKQMYRRLLITDPDDYNTKNRKNCSVVKKKLEIKLRIAKQRDFLNAFYSTLLYLPPLIFHCVGGCWDPN